MAINYKLVQRPNPLKPQDPKKFYANPVYNSKKGLRRISQDIARQTTVSTADTMAVLESLLTVIPVFLLDGDIINLGDFGSFRITFRSSGTLTEDEFTSSNINDFHLHFHPGKEFSDQLLTAQATKLPS
jgi:predicted histone-like DNA-binding protein